MWNCTFGNAESSFVSQINKMSNLVLTNSFKDSNVFLIELMFNCAHIKRFTFARRTPFKIVLAESRESVIYSHSWYLGFGRWVTCSMHVRYVRYVPCMFDMFDMFHACSICVRYVPCMFDMCNTGLVDELPVPCMFGMCSIWSMHVQYV